MKSVIIFLFMFLCSHSVYSDTTTPVGSYFTRVVQNGKEATYNSKSWRSVVRINTVDRDGAFWTCTGTFITYEKILTATHCLNRGHTLTSVVFYQGHEVFKTVPIERSEQYIALNPSFYPGNYYQDTAVIKISKYILPLGYFPMRTANQNDFNYFSELTGRKVFMIGASDNKMGGLAFAEGIVEDASYTIDVVGKDALAGICGGDSGGPLVIDNGRELVLVGVLAGYHMKYNRVDGDNCTEGGIYAPYTGEVSSRIVDFI